MRSATRDKVPNMQFLAMESLKALLELNVLKFLKCNSFGCEGNDNTRVHAFSRELSARHNHHNAFVAGSSFNTL